MFGREVNPLCSSPSCLGPSLEEKLFSSCDLTAAKKAQVSFRSQQPLAERGPRARVSTQFHSSTRARNWALPPGDLSSVFTVETPSKAPPTPAAPTPAAGPRPPPQTSSNGGERRSRLLSPSLSSFSTT